MRTPSPEKIRELNRRGVRVEPTGEVTIVAPVKEAPKEAPKVEPPQKDSAELVAIVKTLEAQAKNTESIGKILAEITKPAPKKNFTSTVSRGPDGRIKSIKTVEQ